jgi:hypothetical protein
MNKIPFLILLVVCLGCGLFKREKVGSNVNLSSANTASDAERSRKFFELHDKRVEFASIPTKVELTTEPYVKGKVLFLKTRDSQPPTVMNISQVKDPYSPEPGPLETDPLLDLMAQSPDDIGTVVLINDDLYEDGCKEVEKKLYKSEDGKYLNGYAQVCEVTIIDRSIPAVVFKKKFEGVLKPREYTPSNKGYVLAEVDRKEIYGFLAGLPRR